MKVLMISAVFLCAFATQTLTQTTGTCDPRACEESARCHKLKHIAEKAEKMQCVERCFAASGVSTCYQERPEPPAGLEECIDRTICSADNINSVSDWIERMSGRFGGRGGGMDRDREGGGWGKSKGHHHGGKGKGGCHGGKGKGGRHGGKAKMLEMLLGDAMTQQARQFMTCMEDCHSCDGEEQGPECPEAEGCMMKGLKYSAMKQCFDREGGERPERPDMSEKCKCLIRTLAPTASPDVCDRIGGRSGERSRGGSGGRGDRRGGKIGRRGGRFGGSQDFPREFAL